MNYAKLDKIAQINVNDFINRYGLEYNNNHNFVINDLKQLICDWAKNPAGETKSVSLPAHHVFKLMLNYQLKEEEIDNYYKDLETCQK